MICIISIQNYLLSLKLTCYRKEQVRGEGRWGYVVVNEHGSNPLYKGGKPPDGGKFHNY